MTEISGFYFHLNVFAHFLSLTTDGPIIIMLWMYFAYFFTMKKQAYTKKYRVFSIKQKCIVIWVLLIIIFNSVTFCANNIFEVLMSLKVFSKSFAENWFNIMYFIQDFLILNDGLLILWMYKSLSKFKRGKKRKSGNQYV